MGERFPRRRNITVIHEPAEELACSKPEGHGHGHNTGPEKRGRMMKWEGRWWPDPGTASFLHAHGTPPEASKRGWRPGYNYLIDEDIPEFVLMSPLLRRTDALTKFLLSNIISYTIFLSTYFFSPVPFNSPLLHISLYLLILLIEKEIHLNISIEITTPK